MSQGRIVSLATRRASSSLGCQHGETQPFPTERSESSEGNCLKPTSKNTEAEYIPDIQQVLGSGSLLQIVKVKEPYVEVHLG